MAEKLGIRVGAPGQPRTITRRDAAKAAGGAILAAGSATAAADQVVFGVVGAGSRGQYLLSCLNRISGGRCAAVCDPDPQNLRKAALLTAGSPQQFPDHRPLLARKDIDAVIVASPPYTHFAIVRDALAAGKHVFCENTLVFAPREVAELRKLASAGSERILQVGLQRRYSLFYQTAKQMVAKGMLGEVTDIQAQWHLNPGWTMAPDQPKERNWRFFREFSGGLTAECAAHQIDVANWMFVDTPEFVTGVGSLDWRRDGRDIYDNIALILKYSGGRKMTWSSINTNRHLAMLGGARKEFGEIIMGTEGTIEITVGNQDEPAIGIWFYEPIPAKAIKSEEQKEMAKIVGATVASPGRSAKGFPILFARDQISGVEPFLERELKYARRWLYSKGVMVPREERNPVDIQMESFFENCRNGRTPKAGLDAGLDSSAVVMLANLAMDEGRRVNFGELEKLGQPGAAARKKK